MPEILEHLPRDRWLTQPKALDLLTAGGLHVLRYIQIALATGTRSAAILGLLWEPSKSADWIDLERGIMHRKGTAERDTTLPRDL